jgi:DNA-binding transcriptional LysR family regulator
MIQNLLAERGLSFERLASFLLVAEAGGISRVAQDDPVRQSLISRQIGELETYFGIPLTRREGRRLVLTEQGRELAALIRAQLGGLHDFRQSCAQKPVELNFGAGDSLLTWVILPRMAAFQKKFPRVQVRLFNLRSSEIRRRLTELQLDFGLARVPAMETPLQHFTLGRVRYRLFIPQQLIALHHALTPAEAIGIFPLATLGSDGEFFQQLMTGAEKRKTPLNIKLVTESFPQAAHAAATGHYAAILPAHAEGDAELRNCTVVDLPFLQKAGRQVALGWNPRLLRTRPQLEPMREELGRLLQLT